tara:strand:- start:126 stop:470 length:345 start_codon:yes stop_codon:yes gene_type:complete
MSTLKELIKATNVILHDLEERKRALIAQDIIELQATEDQVAYNWLVKQIAVTKITKHYYRDLKDLEEEKEDQAAAKAAASSSKLRDFLLHNDGCDDLEKKRSSSSNAGKCDGGR